MLKKIRSLAYQHAIPATFIIFVFCDLLMIGISRLLSLLPKSLPMAYLIEIILMLVPAAFVLIFGFSRAFKNGSFFRGLLCCLPFFVCQLIMLLVLLLDFSGNPESNWNPWYLIIYGVFTIVGVGVREECIYRATLQNILAKKYANSVKGIWITVIVSSIIFGLSHVPNIFFNVTPSAVLDQSISAVFVGILFGAVYLRSGNLWVLILIHTLTDVASLSSSIFLRNVSDVEVMNQQLSFSWGSMIYNLILVGIAAFLLRPSKLKQIQESFCFDKRE